MATDIDKATGATLDAIGASVGLARGRSADGRLETDADYRADLDDLIRDGGRLSNSARIRTYLRRGLRGLIANLDPDDLPMAHSAEDRSRLSAEVSRLVESFLSAELGKCKAQGEVFPCASVRGSVLPSSVSVPQGWVPEVWWMQHYGPDVGRGWTPEHLRRLARVGLIRVGYWTPMKSMPGGAEPPPVVLLSPAPPASYESAQRLLNKLAALEGLGVLAPGATLVEFDADGRLLVSFHPPPVPVQEITITFVVDGDKGKP